MLFLGGGVWVGAYSNRSKWTWDGVVGSCVGGLGKVIKSEMSINIL